MKKSLAAAGAILVLFGLGLPAPASAQKAPKNAAVFDEDIAVTTGAVSDLATVTLRRFKKKRILRVEASLEVLGASSGEIALLDGVSLNGRSLQFESTACTDADCFVEGSTFVDLDSFAASFPDDVKGKPLVVVVRGRAEVEGSSPPVKRRMRVLVQLVAK